MSLLERVQHILNERGLTIKQAERESGLSNATIRKWSTQNPSLESLTKLANYLHISIDYLVSGDRDVSTLQDLSCDGVPLSEDEADLVAMYRLLDDRNKEDVFDLVNLKYEKMTGERGSTYSTYSDTNKQQKSDSDEGSKTRPETA